MATLTATTPTNTGTLAAPAAVAASDTISRDVMGPKGAHLKIINGNAASDSVTISDAGSTPAGNALTGGTISATVTNGTSKWFKISHEQVNPATNLVTITHSVTATVTYELLPI